MCTVTLGLGTLHATSTFYSLLLANSHWKGFITVLAVGVPHRRRLSTLVTQLVTSRGLAATTSPHCTAHIEAMLLRRWLLDRWLEKEVVGERMYETLFYTNKPKLSQRLNVAIKHNRLFSIMKIADNGVHVAYAYPLHASIGGLVAGCHGDELCQVPPVPSTTATSLHPKPSHRQTEKKSHLQNTNKRQNTIETCMFN